VIFIRSDAFEEFVKFRKLITKAANFASSAHRSTAAANFNENQENLKRVPKMNLTRWTSQLKCLRVLKNTSLDHLTQLGNIIKDKIIFDSKEYAMLHDLVAILEPFDEVTDILPGSKYSTISKVALAIAGLLAHLNESLRTRFNGLVMHDI
jgi:hypothetical protein